MYIKEKLACLVILVFLSIKYSSQSILKVNDNNITKPLEVIKCKSSEECSEDELCYTVIGFCVCRCLYTSENCKCDSKINKIIIDLAVVESLNTNFSATSTNFNTVNSTVKTSNKLRTNIFQNIDITNTLFTVGFGFGLPILLACLIIVFFIYFLRKKYLLDINHHHLYPSAATNTLNHELMTTNENSGELCVERGNYFLNLNSTIQREDVFPALLTQDELTNENQIDDHHKKPPPIYEEISAFSRVDKLPTYSSFRRKSSSKFDND